MAEDVSSTEGAGGTEDLSELARRLSAARRTVEGVCPVCGTHFTGPANKRFDKHSCAVIDSRRRRTAEKRAEKAGNS